MDRRRNDVLATLDAHGPSLHAIVLRLTLRRDVAEDLMQELFLRLARSRGFAAAADPGAYAARAAVNLALDWRRSRDRQQAPLTDDPVGGAPSPLAALADAEQTQAVLDALSRLRDPGRQVLVMRYVQQESYETIARRLSKDARHVRSLASKALARLRSQLGVWVSADAGDAP